MLGKKKMSVVASSAIGLVWLAAGAAAQPTEYVYGPGNTQDQAFRRVTPVVNCLGGGYIAVGTHDQTGTNPELYVVRTNNAGAQLWELVYDIQGNQSIDEGAALAEMANGSGFVLLGNTLDAQGVWNISLTKINCQGLVLWSQLYQDPNNLNLRGYDLIETTTGNPLAGTAAGDLAVAGYSFGASGTNDAYLMRTNNVGGLIWNIAYDNLVAGVPSNEIFRALTEARPVAPQPTGDLVAVGRFVNLANTNVQGLVARVNGDTGAVGAAPQCMAHHGGGSADMYHSVVQLLAGPMAGQFALVGVTTNPLTWLDDIWVVRGNPCGIMAQTRIGNAAPATIEAALDVREVRGFVPATNVAIGDLALTGYHGTGLNGPFDAYLLFVRAGNLAPIFGNLFGDHLQANEVGVSLAQTRANGPQPQGFVVAGLSQTDWDGFGDPQDLYLVITNAAGGTNCDVPWNPTSTVLNWLSVQLQPAMRSPALNNALQTPHWPLFSPLQVCF